MGKLGSIGSCHSVRALLLVRLALGAAAEVAVIPVSPHRKALSTAAAAPKLERNAAAIASSAVKTVSP